MGIDIYRNGSWEEINDLKCRRNGEWKQAELRRFGSGGWELLWPCHFTYTKQYPLSDFVVFKSKAIPTQLDKEYLVTGCSNIASSHYLHDTLMFFPVETMIADLSGSSIVGASLRLRRLPEQANSGMTIASIHVGCALSGVDPSATGNEWTRDYTLLTESPTRFAYGQTRDVPIGTEGITALLDGSADCLCLPTEPEYTYVIDGYGFFDPSAVVLSVDYYI